MKYFDNTGNPIITNEEVMLIFGGMTFRGRNINSTKVRLFDMCEYFDEKYQLEPESRPEIFKTCAEEILQDVWRYYRVRNFWSYIKIDYHKINYASLQAPSGRYGHAYAYIYTENSEERFYTGEVYVRKFMYIYGGFSYDCHTACSDIWRYEIPYVPLSVPPPLAGWTNTGNHWTNL